MSHPSFRFALAVCVVLAGCATRPFDRSTEPGGKPLGTTTAGTIVISGDALSGDATLTVMDVLRKAVPQMRTARAADANRCPTVELRGRDSIRGSSNPAIYVDGARTIDTCPLVTMQAMDARLIEVYPLGVTSRAGYPTNGQGLILIFVQRADGSGSE